jgi:hypothetical protein
MSSPARLDSSPGCSGTVVAPRGFVGTALGTAPAAVPTNNAIRAGALPIAERASGIMALASLGRSGERHDEVPSTTDNQAHPRSVCSSLDGARALPTKEREGGLSTRRLDHNSDNGEASHHRLGNDRATFWRRHGPQLGSIVTQPKGKMSRARVNVVVGCAARHPKGTWERTLGPGRVGPECSRYAG